MNLTRTRSNRDVGKQERRDVGRSMSRDPGQHHPRGLADKHDFAFGDQEINPSTENLRDTSTKSSSFMTPSWHTHRQSQVPGIPYTKPQTRKIFNRIHQTVKSISGGEGLGRREGQILAPGVTLRPRGLESQTERDYACSKARPIGVDEGFQVVDVCDDALPLGGVEASREAAKAVHADVAFLADFVGELGSRLGSKGRNHLSQAVRGRGKRGQEEWPWYDPFGSRPEAECRRPR